MTWINQRIMRNFIIKHWHIIIHFSWWLRTYWKIILTNRILSNKETCHCSNSLQSDWSFYTSIVNSLARYWVNRYSKFIRIIIISTRNFCGLSLISLVENLVIKSTSSFIIILKILKCKIVVYKFLYEWNIFWNYLFALFESEFFPTCLKFIEFIQDVSDSNISIWDTFFSRELSKSWMKRLVLWL